MTTFSMQEIEFPTAGLESVPGYVPIAIRLTLFRLLLLTVLLSTAILYLFAISCLIFSGNLLSSVNVHQVMVKVG